MPETQRIAVDTSVIVAGLFAWHEHHEPALSALQGALDADAEVVLPARVLIEAYSVMTRLPAQHRLAPADAYQALKGTFSGAIIVGLPPSESWTFLEDAIEKEIRGGAVYDAEILACIYQAGVEEVLTLNRAHFERMAPEGLRVVVPGQHGD